MSFLNELNHKLFTASLAGITALLGANTFMGYYHHSKIDYRKMFSQISSNLHHI